MDPQTAIAEVQKLLPWWVVWADEWLQPLVAGVCCGVVAWLMTFVVLALTPKAKPSDHWSIRARAAWPARCALANFIWIGPIICFVLVLVIGGAWSSAPKWITATITGFASVLAIGWIACSYEQRLMERQAAHDGDPAPRRQWYQLPPLVTWFRQLLTSTLVRHPHLLVLLVMVAALPNEFNVWTVVSIVVGMLAMLWLASGGNLAIATAFGMAQKAPPRLQAIVDETSASMNVPCGPTYQIHIRECNAYAFPLRGRLGFTDDLVEHLSDDEIRTICAHELGHVSEPWTVRLMRLSMTPVLAILGATSPIIHTFGVNVAVGILLASVIGSRGVRQLARKMESRADEYGQHENEDQTVYARALEKIYERNFVPVVISEKAVHPALYDRMLAAGVEPDYPRPDPPSNRVWLVALVLAFVGASAWFLVRDALVVKRLRAARTDPAAFTTLNAHMAIAMTSNDELRAIALLHLVESKRARQLQQADSFRSLEAIGEFNEAHQVYRDAAAGLLIANAKRK